MKKHINKIKSHIVTHKVFSLIILIVIVSVGYWGYRKITDTSDEIRYIISKVEKGNIIASISGTGQVSASSQIDIKPKVSGEVAYILVKEGQSVNTGTIIIQLDAKDAQKTVRDAEASLESAKLSLEKFKLQNSDENMNADLLKAYDDGFTTVSDAFLDLPSIITGLDDFLGLNNLSDNAARMISNTARDYRDSAEKIYYEAKNMFEDTRKVFRTLDRNSEKSEIEAIINETYETVKLINDAVKTMKNFVDYMAEESNTSSEFTSIQNTLSTYTGTVNDHISSLLSIKTDIKDYKDAFPTTNLDLQSSELTVKQKENALQDAKDKLADYYIRAPFEGTIATIDVKKTDSVSSSTVVATLITKKQIAEISFNEVDAAKIKVGQKVELIFDAVQDLKILGEVVEIDSIGKEDQGVVTYDVKISFDTQDDRVKTTMSVSATIITDSKENVLMVPNSAIKSKNGESYIEMFNVDLPKPTDGLVGSISIFPPKKIPVIIGLSNDSKTEIISGLKEGDEIVVRTILPTATTVKTSAPSMFGSSGGNKPSGGIPH
ncbi:MAG: HlyD family efflux transporter periplasmic adaptor subunit [Candidatus Paceibacterota bacterium]|jgi:HlyD family secretion protein